MYERANVSLFSLHVTIPLFFCVLYEVEHVYFVAFVFFFFASFAPNFYSQLRCFNISPSFFVGFPASVLIFYVFSMLRRVVTAGEEVLKLIEGKTLTGICAGKGRWVHEYFFYVRVRVRVCVCV
uniref:Uncharacterized protein n=1 Tax=Trypanosoma congolense (strain IL3000) TaxID=1068625 RepID=G0UN56_TRYCI|nr:hypothetical protein, unlikely [Trypanosoma congolense IL3000]